MSERFHRALPVEQLAEGMSRALEINGWPIVVCVSEGRHHAVINRCTHADSPLAEGRVRRGAIICPQHGAPFNLATGACAASLGYRPLKLFCTRIVDGWVEVSVPDSEPGPQHRPVRPRPADSWGRLSNCM